ncbi:speckle-type POZ protein-like [Daphnia pulex]|uniref:speckle-type POZ protein-like n=1 Tax=Daphnia pulex TaxID=6669 RepID=UPI001EDF6735|nr:speckle-type POZ protein-like [Daphnia pulex]
MSAQQATKEIIPPPNRRVVRCQTLSAKQGDFILQANKEILPTPGSIAWCQTQNEVVQLKFEWTIHQLAFLKTFEKWGDYYSSQFFHEKTPESKWTLRLSDEGANIKISLEMPYPNQLANPVRVKIAISNRKREQIFPQQQCLPQYTKLPCCVFQIAKKSLVESRCFVNGKLTIYCEIESFVLKNPVLSGKSSTVANLDEKPFGNSDQLVAQLTGLFGDLKFSDIAFNVRGRQFKAHKSILASRSKFFTAMFEHPTQENLTNQVEVEDVEPDVFNEILRFIYTGKVSESTMENMPFEIFAVADKYLLDQLKIECETHIIHRMSVENCLELLLNTHEHHPAFHLRQYAVEFFRNFSSEVMATRDWEKAKKDNPEKCFSVLQDLVKSLV